MNNNISKPDALLLLDIIHASLACTGDIDIKNLITLTKTLVSFDYARCLFGDSKEYDTKKMKALKMISEFPKEWEDRYKDKDYFLYDNIALIAFSQTGLKYWDDYVELQEAREYRNLKSKIIFEEAGSVGLREGWIYSLKGRSSTERAIISIAGDRCEKNERTKTILEYLAPHLSLAIKRVIMEFKETQVKLTAREYEVLSWTAAGKTSWEISLILKISSRTVEFHMGNILHKLDAVNSQQAVAIAVSSGLISY